MTAGDNSQSVALFELFADDYSREILLAADETPQTAKELSQRCDASLATIYRRLSTLQEHDLIRVHSTIGSGGEHKQRYETTIERLHVAISDGELELSVETRDELADNFNTLWDNLRENI